jgi:hypothetical protein
MREPQVHGEAGVSPQRHAHQLDQPLVPFRVDRQPQQRVGASFQQRDLGRLEIPPREDRQRDVARQVVRAQPQDQLLGARQVAVDQDQLGRRRQGHHLGLFEALGRIAKDALPSQDGALKLFGQKRFRGHEQHSRHDPLTLARVPPGRG